MNKDEIRKILALVRLGGQDADDPLIASAKESAQRDPELARWFEEQQEFDRKFAEAVGGIPIPAGLQTRIMSIARERIRQRSLWPRHIGRTAAAIAVLAVLFSSWRGLFQPAVSVADFRSEMVSFIRLTPSLDLESREAGADPNLAEPHRRASRSVDSARIVGARTSRMPYALFSRAKSHADLLSPKWHQACASPCVGSSRLAQSACGWCAHFRAGRRVDDRGMAQERPGLSSRRARRPRAA